MTNIDPYPVKFKGFVTAYDDCCQKITELRVCDAGPANPTALKRCSLRARQLAGEIRLGMVNSVFGQYHVQRVMPESTMHLSEREAPRWSAAGKIYAEIARILAVDDRTIKFHLANAMRKLNATNKPEAAVKASILGLLWVGAL